MHRSILAAAVWLLALPAVAQPVADMPGVSIREVAAIPQDDNQHPVRIAHHAGTLYVLDSAGTLYALEDDGSGGFVPNPVLTKSEHGVPGTIGMAFATDGSLYLLGNENVGSAQTRFIIRNGTPTGATWTWRTVAESDPYLLSHTWFDHKANGLALSPDQATLLVNSGSRTDHGEMYGGVREEGLTAIVLSIPADGQDLSLPNDRETLRSQGYVFAEGVRNSFDLEFAPNGDLLAADNAGDRDDSEELNWIRQGHHYGFPWRIGTSETPQQHAGYDPSSDPFVQPDRNTSNLSDTGWYFSHDPGYPVPPAGLAFTDPIPNAGPFADKFRSESNGNVGDASRNGVTVGSFTPHRSPLGLVFDADSVLASPMRGGAFIVSWNSADDQLLQRLGGTGEDLLFLDLDKSSGSYTMTAERVAHGFDHPIDAVMVGSTIFVIEFGEPWGPGGRRSVQAVTLPGGNVATEEAPAVEPWLSLYPNPARSQLTVSIGGADRPVQLEVYDVLGRLVHTEKVASGPHRVSTSGLPDGLYFVRAGHGRSWHQSTVVIRR